MGEDKSVLKWGGLGGLLAGVLFLVGIILGVALAGPDPISAEEQIVQYPERGAGPRAFASLAMVAVILLVGFFLALYRALRRPSLATALFGSVLAVLGLVFLAFSAANTLVTYPFLSGLYHAPGATPEDQVTLVLLWRYTFEGIFRAAFFAQSLFVSIGVIALGVAMLRSPDFGKGFGGVSVVLGVAGVAGGVLSRIVSGAEFLYIIAFLIFPLLFGWKVYNMSRTA